MAARLTLLSNSRSSKGTKPVYTESGAAAAVRSDHLWKLRRRLLCELKLLHGPAATTSPEEKLKFANLTSLGRLVV